MKCDELKSLWVYSRDIDENCDEEFVNFAKENGYEELVEKKEVIEAIAELKAENERLKEECRWRNCSEELPEKDKYVLAFCPNLKSIEIARIIDDEWRDFSWNYLEVTHWMPLPLAPKEKE